MKILALLLLVLLPTPVQADAEVIEAFLETKTYSKDRWRTLLRAECLDALNDELNELFALERKDHQMPPFSQAWCVGQKHTSQEFREGGEEH